MAKWPELDFIDCITRTYRSKPRSDTAFREDRAEFSGHAYTTRPSVRPGNPIPNGDNNDYVLPLQAPMAEE